MQLSQALLLRAQLPYGALTASGVPQGTNSGGLAAHALLFFCHRDVLPSRGASVPVTARPEPAAGTPASGLAPAATPPAAPRGCARVCTPAHTCAHTQTHKHTCTHTHTHTHAPTHTHVCTHTHTHACTHTPSHCSWSLLPWERGGLPVPSPQQRGRGSVPLGPGRHAALPCSRPLQPYPSALLTGAGSAA